MFLISDYVCIYINLLIVQSIWIHIKVSSFQYSLLKNGGLKNGGICLYGRYILCPFRSDVSVTFHDNCWLYNLYSQVQFLKSWCNKTSVLLTSVMYVFLIIFQLYFPCRLEWKLEIHANLKVSSWVLILDKIIKHVTKGNYYNRLKEHIQDYGMATTIGGIHYFTSNRRGSKER